MKERWGLRSQGFFVALCLLLSSPLCRGNLIFDVSVDTSALIGNPAGPFSIEFQLNDGSGTNDGNNTVLVSNFNFGGGMPVGAATLIGGAIGDLSSTVKITDNNFLNEFFQEFVPGPILSFHVNLSTLVDPGPQPDQYSFAILDCSLIEIPTTSPANALVAVDINQQLTIQTFRGDPNGVLGCNGAPGIPLPTPRIVSEPGSLSLSLLGVLTVSLLAMLQRRRAFGNQFGRRRGLPSLIRSATLRARS